MKLAKRITLSSLAALAALGLVVQPAAADTIRQQGPIKASCSGTVLETWQLRDGGKAIGRVELWFDGSAHGGQNCVVTHNYLPGSPETGALLIVDDNDNRRVDSVDRASFDIGNYSRYAGASYRNGTRGHCVKVLGYVIGPNLRDRIETPLRNCG